MTRPRPRPRLGLAATAVAAALAASLVPGAVGGSAATAPVSAAAGSAPEPGALTLLAAQHAEMYGDGDRAYGDLGVRLAARDGRVELRTRRLGWDEQPETRLFRGGWVEGTTAWADGRKVPRRLVAGFDRLDDLLTVSVTDARGETVATRTMDACLNGYEPQRLSPDSPATPYYPGACPRGEFTLGSVQGVESGYAVSPQDWSRLPIGAGRYTVTASVDGEWADLLGMAGREVTYGLQVRGEGGRRVEQLREEHRDRLREQRATPPAEPGPRPAPSEARGATGMADMAGMSHSVDTVPCGYEPGADDPLPDLESLPAFGIQAAGDDLRFSATVWNAGDSPLVVDGFRRGDEEAMDAYQYFYTRDEDGDLDQQGYCQVGGMHWHAAPSHHHWHFLDFARYRLVSAKDTDRTVRSTKQSFCLANTDAVDYTRPGADWRPEGTDLSSACGARSAQSLRQVLSAGSGDTYVQFRAGQAFRLKGVPNGWYDILVEANPRDLLHEADEVESKDVAARRIHLGGKPGARTVRVPALGLVCGQPRGDCS